MQPHYWELPQKIAAREENAAVYRRLTGNHSIPKDKGYWTLCNEQPLNPGSEIEQNCRIGLIRKSQFFGVDRDQDKDGNPLGLIDTNRRLHPEANWFRGDWVEVLRECDNFDPALIYLDSTSFADHIGTAKMTAFTMTFCQKGTVLLVNTMKNDPRSSIQFDYTMFPRHLEKLVNPFELKKWSPKVENYWYNASGKTNMVTYILHKLED